MNRQLTISLLCLFAIGLGVWVVQKSPLGNSREQNKPSSHPPLFSYSPQLSPLGTAPDWTELKAYANTRTSDEIRDEIERIYSASPVWKEWLKITDDTIEVRTENDWIIIPLASNKSDKIHIPNDWNQTPPTPPKELPLAGRHIAIDAGHIGGDYAKIEERWFQIGNSLPIAEGTMTLVTAKHLENQLKQLGATVSLVRSDLEPVTSYRPKDFQSFVLQKYGQDSSREMQKKRSELLFYRTAEIRSRADLINNTIKPHLVICLHFNAVGWGNPLHPTLSDKQHLHLLVNGAYTDGEWKHSDERFQLLTRLFQGTHEIERDISLAIIDSFTSSTSLPPYIYEKNSSRARRVTDDSDYLWARNLLANRVYNCPVIFMEPYVMNSKEFHLRAQAGDYNGLRSINGKILPSIYQEYASAIATGIENYYLKSSQAIPHPPTPNL